MIAMALQFFGLLPRLHRVAIGFGGSTLAASLRSLLTAHGRAAPLAFRRVQRLPALSAGLRLRRPGGEHGRSAARLSHHGVVRARDLPRDAADGRRRPRAGAGVAAAWRVAGRQLHSAARSRSPSAAASCPSPRTSPMAGREDIRHDGTGPYLVQPLPAAGRAAGDASAR